MTRSELKALYEIERLSTTQIAALDGRSISTVRRELLRAGCDLRDRGDAMRLRVDVIAEASRSRVREPYTVEQIERMRTAAHRRWAGKARGTRINSKGYVEFTSGPDVGRLQHDVIVEQRIGRRLRPDEIVHHRDECRSNNDPSNLELMTRGEHSRLHRLAEPPRPRSACGRFVSAQEATL